jgi:cytochrome b561/polyisoprenoid-binding protein YceI
MSWDFPEDKYGGVARCFHWVMALVIVGLLMAGLYMTGMEYGPEKLQIYGLHKSFGLLILWLVFARVIWRFVAGTPEEMETHAVWEKQLAKLAHFFLYAAMFGMPITGWLMSSAGEFPVSFFGIPVPPLTGKDDALFDLMRETHEILGFSLIGGIALHAAGAFKHHFLDKDNTLMRMMVFGKTGVYLALTVLAVFFAGAGYLVLMDKEPADVQETSSADTGDMVLKDLAPNEWQIIPAQSALTFTASLSGTPFEGKFGSFDGTIFFNPENLKSSRALITVNLGSVNTGSPERDEQILTADWFDTANFPQATFETIEFVQGEGNNYIAIGNLTLRGTALPVTMPFTLTLSKDSDGRPVADVKGTMDLSRLSFGVGQGQWQSTGQVDENVKVLISVRAVGK